MAEWESSTQHEEAFEQAGWVFFRQKQQLELYKNGWQDCTCYSKPPPSQVGNVTTDILRFNTNIKIYNGIFTKALFEIVSKCSRYYRNNKSNLLM